MKRFLSKMDKPLLFLTIIMFLFGLLMIFSASTVPAALSGNPYSIFFKHTLNLIICFFSSWFIIKVPIKNYKKIITLALYSIIGILFLVFSYGVIVNSTKSWIDFGFYSFQPSEFAKTILIVYFGIYYAKYKNSNKYIKIYTPLLYSIAICTLVFFQPDFGTMSIIAGIVALVFIALPINKQFKKQAFNIALGGTLIVILVLLVNNKQIFRDNQLSRFQFSNPCQRYTENTGYQVCNGFIAINNGGLTGVGLGNSTQKYLYLPAVYTDFIFPVIVEELGLITGIIIILIYIYIIYKILRIAKKTHDLKGAIIAYGVAMYILLHVLVNLVGVLGLLPLTGVPLPFLSYGGSYALNLAVCLAIVQRIEIENNIYIQKKMIG